MAKPAPPFALQRIVFCALLMGMAMYAIGVAVLLQQSGGKGLTEPPIEALDTVATFAGIGLASAAMLVRRSMHAVADKLAGTERAAARFRATLVPMAILEGGCLLGLTTWLLNGRAVPGLVTALMLLALAILIVPFSDPDERGS